MYGNTHSFFGIVRPLLVRGGVDVKLPKNQHTMFNVYREMMLQVARDYSGIPDIREMNLTEILFFYNGLRPELKAHTKPRKK